MSEPRVILELEQHEGPYWPGDEIKGKCRVGGAKQGDVKVVEISVLWYTLGKGEEDLAVHYFHRATGENGEPLDASATCGFETKLPNSPLSYDGLIVKLCWCVRARVFFKGGKEQIAEKPFQLGTTPRPEVAPS